MVTQGSPRKIEKFNRHELCISSPTHPASGDLSTPWFSLEVFGSPEVIWLILANLQPPRNIWFRLKLMVTEINLLLFVNMSSSKCDQSEVHTVSWEETKQLFNYCLVGQRRSALKLPHFQARVPHICPTHHLFGGEHDRDLKRHRASPERPWRSGLLVAEVLPRCWWNHHVYGPFHNVITG